MKSQITFVGLRYIDGVNWEKYHLDYAEELRVIQKTNSTLINLNDIEIQNNRIINKNPKTLPLLAGHKLLYETILTLNPTSILEIGCGGGDHLYNLQVLNPKFLLAGVDRSTNQINFLRQRHPKLSQTLNLECIDLTMSGVLLPKTSLIFTQAVLMHISEKDSRFQTALENLFLSDSEIILLMENWTQHDFFSSVRDLISKITSWNGAKMFYVESDLDNTIRAMVISKIRTNFIPLIDYDQLLGSKKILPH